MLTFIEVDGSEPVRRTIYKVAIDCAIGRILRHIKSTEALRYILRRTYNSPCLSVVSVKLSIVIIIPLIEFIYDKVIFTVRSDNAITSGIEVRTLR